ncbi:multifunctional tRNA nucleotidyl transferase / 2'3'-cyclic phosphodiesterase / 2'nucleotidase / phosphatase [Campylobacter sp. RM5004]|uniref:CCA tRNA nucleotidyltransferase n=1 Tax=Campylobacter sp. RM5004 TaxID=1660078 RepID=UPI001EFB2D42|nr:CCA tRNA nucleotidyltransferase [Campylobacter sp. RM5004]ULO01745.1 multifunctional tRNA nucleotidyl transferase / 2'3'-cyclic phosphodiesterase / 2'nucleotidase / phosphatase [Campylobacter sp. RM5004]
MLPWNEKTFLEIKSTLFKYTKRAYFVGGCVRDIYLNNHTNDYDIEIYDVSPSKMEEIAKELNALGVGKSFFVYKKENYDLALARTERKIGNLHTDFSVKVENNEYKGSLRRDFCMNTIMINIFTKEVLDLHKGIRDCKKKLIRIVNYDTFKEDSLRVLRFIQFIARFKLKTNKKDLEYLKKIDISNLSKDRIYNELIKLFEAKYPEIGLYYLYKLNLFEKCFGFNVSKASFFSVLKKIKDNKALVCKEKRFALMFFYFIDYFNIYYQLMPYKKMLLFLTKEPKISIIDDYNLCKIAIKMPLKEWLGLNKDIKKRALKLGIYDDKIKVLYENISSKEEALKCEEIAIKEYLKNV